MRPLKHDEKLVMLKRWEENYRELDARWSELERLTGGDTDSPLGNAVWLVWQDCTDMLGAILRDDEMLSWYWLENGMGKEGLEAGVEGDVREIRSIEDLLWVIERANKET